MLSVYTSSTTKLLFIFTRFWIKSSAISIFYLLQATYILFSEDTRFFARSCLISSINLSVSDVSLTEGSDGSFSDDENDDEKTSPDSVSDSTNEVSRFFVGGLAAYYFTGCSLNIEGTLPSVTFFFPLPKIVFSSSSLK